MKITLVQLVVDAVQRLSWDSLRAGGMNRSFMKIEKLLRAHRSHQSVESTLLFHGLEALSTSSALSRIRAQTWIKSFALHD